MSVILDPAIGAFVWLHMAPSIGDWLRRSHWKLLRWNDEFPFVKSSLAADDRPPACAGWADGMARGGWYTSGQCGIRVDVPGSVPAAPSAAPSAVPGAAPQP